MSEALDLSKSDPELGILTAYIYAKDNHFVEAQNALEEYFKIYRYNFAEDVTFFCKIAGLFGKAGKIKEVIPFYKVLDDEDVTGVVLFYEAQLDVISKHLLAENQEFPDTLLKMMLQKPMEYAQWLALVHGKMGRFQEALQIVSNLPEKIDYYSVPKSIPYKVFFVFLIQSLLKNNIPSKELKPFLLLAKEKKLTQPSNIHLEHVVEAEPTSFLKDLVRLLVIHKKEECEQLIEEVCELLPFQKEREELYAFFKEISPITTELKKRPLRPLKERLTKKIKA